MGKILGVRPIIRLAQKHSEPPFCEQDEAMIALAGLAYFSGTDLSPVRVRDLITERGGIIVDGYLPETFSASGKSRYFFIGRDTYLRRCLEGVVKWRLTNNFNCLDRGLYLGLDPESHFILKDSGQPFRLTYKQRFEGDTLTQPLQLLRHFKTFYLGEGVTLGSLMDSFISIYWEAKSKQGTTQAIKDLMEMTCLTAETLKKKCIRQQDSIQDILANLYK